MRQQGYEHLKEVLDSNTTSLVLVPGTLAAGGKKADVFDVDIAVPRDVDPEMNKLDGIFVYDIDDLQQAVASHVAGRRKEAELAERIINSEVERFHARVQTRDGFLATARYPAGRRVAQSSPHDL